MKMNNKKDKSQTNETLRETKMIDEGGLASEEDLYNKKATEEAEDISENEELREKKKMDDEGAFGVDENLFHNQRAQEEEEKKRK